MIKTGLLGHPIKHSLSPGLHAGFNNQHGELGTYTLFEMPHLPEGGLHEFFSTHDLTGLNITIPFKKTVIDLVDRLDPEAAEIGAVNTIVKQGNALVGYNTDIYGIEKSLDVLDLSSGPVLVFGTGGASKAVTYVLKKRGIEFQTIGRTTQPYSYENLKAQTAASHPVWINCTPIGTAGIKPALLPVPHEVLSEEFAIFDLIYKPNPTPLMQEALTRGARALGGKLMLIEQAKKSWKLFRDAYYKNL